MNVLIAALITLAIVVFVGLLYLIPNIMVPIVLVACCVFVVLLIFMAVYAVVSYVRGDID